MVSIVLKLTVSVSLLWLLARGVDLDAVMRQIAAADRLWLLVAVVLAAAVIPMAAVRWHLVGRAIEAPLAIRDSLSITTIGWFFNQTLPSTIGGDAVRMYLAWRAGISKTGAVHGILLDRLMGLFVVLVLAVAFLPPLVAGLQSDLQRWVLGAVIAAGIAGYTLLFLAAGKFASRLDRFRAGRLARELSRDARTALLTASPGGFVLALSVALQIVQFVSVYAIAVALGLDVAFTSVMIALPAVLLISSLPISLAGWGVREQSMVLALGAMGVAPADAFAISVLLGLSWIVIGLPGALIWLGYRRHGHSLGRTVEVGTHMAD